MQSLGAAATKNIHDSNDTLLSVSYIHTTMVLTMMLQILKNDL